MSKIICRCEEITEDEIIEAIASGASTVNEIKKFSRANMGLCQGRTCRKAIERILSKETGQKLENIKPSSYRKPVRPIKLGLMK